MTALRTALLALLITACADGERPASADSAAESPAPGAGAVAAGVPDSTCPPTGQWASCSILKRLERAGLVPIADSAASAEPPLTPPGLLVRLGRAELEVYLYETAAAREREQALLTPADYVRYTADQTFRAEPTLIGNANMIAILHSNNSKMRERVGDALTAGPPQSP